MNISVRKINDEVLYADGNIVDLSKETISFLKQCAFDSKSGRIRLCAHKDTEDVLHEMFIALRQGSYVRPHRHLNKTESFHIIEGVCHVVILDDNAKVVRVIPMGDYESGHKFFLRIPARCHHTIIIHSEILVFQEITRGPFKREETDFPPWSPDEKNIIACHTFTEGISKDVDAYLLTSQTDNCSP